MQLLTYTVMDASYQNGKLMNVKGLENAVPAASPQAADVGTVNNPTQSVITIDSSKEDPVVFSFEYAPTPTGPKELRMLLATIVTPTPGQASTACLYSLLKMTTNGDWTALATNVQLVTPSPNSVNCANNPHGVAQIGNMLYIVDYDTQMIYPLGGNDLTGTGGICAVGTPISLVSTLSDPYARAQAIIALDNFLFALYISCTADGETHYNGTLVRVDLTSTPPYTKTTVGMNPQMIIPIYPTSGSTILLIPAIGGKQRGGGVGNYTVSNITKVGAFDNWVQVPAQVILVSNGPSTVPTPPVGAPPAVSYTLDIQAIAGPEEGDDNRIVYILSGIYQGDWTSKTYALWKTTADNLDNLGNDTTVLDAYDNGDLSQADTGNVSGYFWDIFYENKGTTGAQVGRLWFLRGSPIIVSPASNYNAGSKFFDRGTGSGKINGENVNSVDLTAEIARQVQAGVSLRRGLRAHKPSIRAAKAAPAVAAAAAAEEEE
jgi:hypothetical protein